VDQGGRVVRFAERVLPNIGRDRITCLDARELHHPTPLLGIVRNKFTKLSRRAWKSAGFVSSGIIAGREHDGHGRSHTPCPCSRGELRIGRGQIARRTMGCKPALYSALRLGA